MTAIVNLNMQAAHDRAINQFGQSVQVVRLTGAAPSVTQTTVTVNAIVKYMQPDSQAPSETGYGSAGLGGLTQTDRLIILMAYDLINAGFPVPVQKNDKIILSTTGEKLDVTRVDGEKS